MTERAGAVGKFHEIALLGMLASGFFALAGSLDAPIAILLLGAMALRVAMVAGWVRLDFPPKLTAVLSGASLVYYLLDQKFLAQSFLTATVHLVCFLAAIKILSAATPRDFAWVRVIALLELLGAAMLSVNPAFFLFLALFLLCTVAAFSSGEVMHSAAGPAAVSRATVRMVPRRLALFSSALFLGILVMTAGMFFVLPRTARAALQRFVPQRYHLPGFSNEISLGEIGEIKQSNTPVMHIKSYQDEPLPQQLHWRGSSLARFDGLRWFNPPYIEEPLRVDRGVLNLSNGRRTVLAGRSLQYEVLLSQIASDTLFFAGTPQTLSIPLNTVRLGPGGSLRVPRRLSGGLHYSVFAVLEDEHAGILSVPPRLSEEARREMLQLPDLDARIPELAREMTEGAQTPEQEARAIEQRLRTDYGYTLELPKTQPEDPLAYFLFDRRKGHCEYFASAMTVMLRTQGIPARIATGFLGGVYNPVTGSQVIRASDAHSWVEAWIEGKGWTTFDPTPADPNASNAGLLNGIALLSDAMSQFWQEWVISYDLERQFVLAQNVEQSTRRFRFDLFEGWGDTVKSTAARVGSHWAWFVALGLAAIGVLFYGSTLRQWAVGWLHVKRVRQGKVQASDATLLYTRMLEALERKGFRKPTWVTPQEFAGMIPAAELSARVARMTAAYNAFRFGGHSERAAEMLTVLEQIERG